MLMVVRPIQSQAMRLAEVGISTPPRVQQQVETWTLDRG